MPRIVMFTRSHEYSNIWSFGPKDVDIYVFSKAEENFVDFISRWNEAHHNNRPDDWKGIWEKYIR